MKRNRWIPFSWLPSSWGLEGNSRLKAEAEYYYDGKELEYELICIDYPEEDTIERMSKELEFMKKWGDISDFEFQKQMANIHGDPWFDVIESKFVPGKNGEGQFVFELDWNEKFVLELKANGWPGISPEEIIDNWFAEVCKQMASNGEIEF